MLPRSRPPHIRSRRAAPVAAALVVLLAGIVAGCGSSGNAASDAAPAEPVGGHRPAAVRRAARASWPGYDATSRKQIALGDGSTSGRRRSIVR